MVYRRLSINGIKYFRDEPDLIENAKAYLSENVDKMKQQI